MMQSRGLILSISVAAFALAKPGLAAPNLVSCTSTSAPAAYATSSCLGRCAATNTGGGWRLTCTTDDSAWLVRDYSGSDPLLYSVFGTESGSTWCCPLADDANVVTQVFLNGGNGDDALSFRWSGAVALTNPSTGVFSAQMDGKGGDDTLTGSPDGTANFHEILYGRGGSDELHGNAGAEDLVGGADADGLFGESGADRLWGGTGSDYLEGGVGANTLCGGGSNDALDGDGFFSSGPFVNVFWEPYSFGFNPPYGIADPLSTTTCGMTTWGSSWAGVGCSYSLSVEPTACTLH